MCDRNVVVPVQCLSECVFKCMCVSLFVCDEYLVVYVQHVFESACLPICELVLRVICCCSSAKCFCECVFNYA